MKGYQKTSTAAPARRRGGKLRKLTPSEKRAKKLRNKRRHRDAVLKVRKILVKEGFNPRAFDGRSKRSKQIEKRTKEIIEEMKRREAEKEKGS